MRRKTGLKSLSVAEMCGGKLFQAAVPAWEKALSPNLWWIMFHCSRLPCRRERKPCHRTCDGYCSIVPGCRAGVRESPLTELVMDTVPLFQAAVPAWEKALSPNLWWILFCYSVAYIFVDSIPEQYSVWRHCVYDNQCLLSLKSLQHCTRGTSKRIRGAEVGWFEQLLHEDVGRLGQNLHAGTG